MKTKDFISRLEKAGYRVHASETSAIKIWIDNELVAYVTPNRRFVMGVYVERLPERVFSLITGYASTSVEEREEVKRWYLVLDIPALDNSGAVYLNQHRKTKNITLSPSRSENSAWKTIFTEADLKDIDETGLKRVPVEDE